jgi:hypothetical protein
MRRRALLVFLDGVGVGPADPTANATLVAELPTLDGLLPQRPSHSAQRQTGAAGRAAAVALDAVLDTPGLPQSGTGQAALLTGVNAARRFGRHFGPWTPVSLRPLVAEESLLAVAARAGRSVAFANAYPEEIISAVGTPRPPMPLRAGPVIAALGAGLLTRSTPALERGDAIASEITNGGWREHLRRTGVPDIDAAVAGRNLARIALDHDLTLFAHYSTDKAGHAGELSAAGRSLERVDAFLGGLLAALDKSVLVVVASDHGNIEDARAGHTRNPALGLVVGDGAGALAEGLGAITDVAPALLRALGVEPSAPAEDAAGS